MKPRRHTPDPGGSGRSGTTRRAFVGGSLAAILAGAIGIGGGIRGRRPRSGRRPPLWIGHM